MRGSLHAHILTWFKQRKRATLFTHLEPIRREEKAKSESRQRPRAHEVPPQPGQVEEGEDYQEDNVMQPNTHKYMILLASYNLGPTNINKIANQINSDVQTVTWTEIREKLKVIKGSELNLVDRESYSRGQQAIDYVDRVKSYYQLLSAHSCIAPKDQLIFF